jgi:hypothetical protein
MGGFGSGRWGWHQKAPTVESCRSIDLVDITHDTPPAAGKSGTVTWFREGKPVASVGFDYAASGGGWVLHVRYHRTPRTPDAAGRDIDLPVRLDRTPTPRGGSRWWGRCPLARGGVACGRRVRFLYMPAGSDYFGCRKCHGLVYASSQEHDPRVDRLIRDEDARVRLHKNLKGASVSTLGLLLKVFTIEQRRHERLDRSFERQARRRARKHAS